MTAGIARPGVKQVPVEVYVAADVEDSGVVVPIDFDEQYLRLARATDGFTARGALVDTRYEASGPSATEGYAVLYSDMSAGFRKLAAEGEEILAGKLYFDVLETADVDPSYALELTDPVGILSHLFLAPPEAFCAEATDFNGDCALEVSDPIALLGHLFVGSPSAPEREALCR